MTDRELLELAAKAAEIKDWVDGWSDKFWNPLTDDGDALRLAVKLKINLTFNWTSTDSFNRSKYEWNRERHGDNPCAATRRAIVRAAAEIGKEM